MKKSLKTIIATSLVATSVFSSGIVSAQTKNVAVVDTVIAIANAKARVDGYNQINTQYANNLQQIRAKVGEARTLRDQVDTNKDGNVSQQEEAANPAVVQQIKTKQSEIQTLQMPITLAQNFLLESLLLQYSASLQSVVTAKKVDLVLGPEGVAFVGPGVDVTQDVTAALNTRVTTPNIVPPANWRPKVGQTFQIHRQIAENDILNARRQQAAAQQQPAAQPQSR